MIDIVVSRKKEKQKKNKRKKEEEKKEEKNAMYCQHRMLFFPSPIKLFSSPFIAFPSIQSTILTAQRRTDSTFFPRDKHKRLYPPLSVPMCQAHPPASSPCRDRGLLPIGPSPSFLSLPFLNLTGVKYLSRMPRSGFFLSLTLPAKPTRYGGMRGRFPRP